VRCRICACRLSRTTRVLRGGVVRLSTIAGWRRRSLFSVCDLPKGLWVRNRSPGVYWLTPGRPALVPIGAQSAATSGVAKAEGLGEAGVLDEETESILFLTDMGDKPARIGFQAQAGGVHYYLTDLKLDPHETRAIDLRKVRDEQKPDLKGNKVPAAATDGSVVWSRLDNVPVMGRLVVLQRHKSMASNYDCYICDCAPDYFDLDVDPAAIALLVYESILFEGEAWFREHCNTYQWPYSVFASFESLNLPVASVTTDGTATGQSGGTASIKALYTDYYYAYDHVLIECIEHPRQLPAYASAKVVTITGPQTVWWFNGQNPSGYTTSVELTANPAGQSQYTWAFSAGSDKATFSGQSGNTINLTGKALSVAPGGDVKVKVTVKFSDNSTKTSADFPITVRGPRSLVNPTVEDNYDQDYGYDSLFTYIIRDNLSVNMPSSVEYNENWTTAVQNDLQGNNWRRQDPPPPGSIAFNSILQDEIQGEAIGLPAIPTPSAPCGPPRCTQKIQHWGQEWRVGSTSPGNGARVQTDTIQKYIDHARHENIVSPAP